jgi:glutathione S-transferase
MYTLYSMQRSGNSYKVRLALAQLGLDYRLVEVDILRGESRTPEFLAKNPSGQVPLLEVMPGRFIAESNAILWYVAGGTPLAPDDRIDRAETLQWMFFEQHSLEPNIGAAYFWLALVKGGRELQQHALEDWMEHGYRPLHHRRYRALRLYPSGASVRLQPDAVPGDPRLARPHRGRARPRDNADDDAERGCRRVALGARLRAFDVPPCVRRRLRRPA